MQLRLCALLLVPWLGCSAEPLTKIPDPLAPNDPADPSDPKDPSDPTDPNDPSDPADPTDPPVVDSGMPCEVDRIFEQRCSGCHAAEPRFGAPMPLTQWSDLHRPAVSDPALPVYLFVADRIADERRPMPPTGDLPPAERAVLEAWLALGAPRATEAEAACATPPPPPPPEDPIGPEHLPCEPSHTIVANGGGAEPFAVPVSAANLYQCFTFRAPFAAGEQATAWAPIIDDERVVHHWILYGTNTPQPDGGNGPCQMPRDAKFLAGWAPGGQNTVLPDDISLELPGQDQWLILQLHYHNASGLTDARDRSGVAMCTTPVARPKVAGFVTLGSIWINIPPRAMGHAVTGECGSNITRLLQGDLTITTSFPHMHQLGRSLRTEILRANGDLEPVIDVPNFDFESQRSYPLDPPRILRPGDGIRTTCVYDNTTDQRVRFGERTEDEMCLNFVLVHPIDLLGDSRSCGLF